MRFSAVLLRLLLCLVLAANATTAAYATTRMASMGGAEDAAAMQHEDAAPCHATQVDDGAAMDQGMPAMPDTHEDCCGSACLCDCIAHATAFVTVDAAAWSPPPAMPPVSAVPVSRAGPALPHPTRPPIG